MIHYLATFVPGFAALVKKQLLKECPDATIIHNHEASIVFASGLPYVEFDKKPYFTNVFMVTAMLETDSSTQDNTVVKQLAQKSDFKKSIAASGKSRVSTFRIMVQKGSKLVHIPKDIQKKIIAQICSQTGLEFSPLKADVEIWFMLRTEGFAYCTIKFPSQFIQHVKTEKGELRPHLAHLLNLLSQPRFDDVYVDPFAGHGALPYNRAKSFKYRKILAYDKDSILVSALRKKLERFPTVLVELGDALHLTRLGDLTVSKIVTDPPWGIYENLVDAQPFYKKMFAEMNRVLIPGGIIVILVTETIPVKDIISAIPQLQIQQAFTTLVNGKKATVYKILKA